MTSDLNPPFGFPDDSKPLSPPAQKYSFDKRTIQLFFIGLCVGIVVGVFATHLFSGHYILHPGDGGLYKINTRTGKTWQLKAANNGYYWDPFYERKDDLPKVTP